MIAVIFTRTNQNLNLTLTLIAWINTPTQKHQRGQSTPIAVKWIRYNRFLHIVMVLSQYRALEQGCTKSVMVSLKINIHNSFLLHRTKIWMNLPLHMYPYQITCWILRHTKLCNHFKSKMTSDISTECYMIFI